MSHLRPNGADGHAKPISSYSEGEKASALMQMSDAAGVRIAQNKPIDKRTASLMVDMAKGTEKEDTLAPEVVDAATAPTKK
jgi:hypothetical protein